MTGSFAAPRISEFMAANVSRLADEEGDFSDWIEVHNPDNVAVPLAGYHLTDDAANLDKWTFPAVTLNPGRNYSWFSPRGRIVIILRLVCTQISGSRRMAITSRSWPRME